MNKIELIQALREANGLSKTEAERVVALFFNEMSNALARGDRVDIRGFCSFFVKEYGPATKILKMEDYDSTKRSYERDA